MDFLSKAMQGYRVEDEFKTTDPVQLFYDQLIQEPGYNYLRDNQTDFLRKWEEKREEKDVVGIMETGSGKTLLGLLMLYSKLSEEVGPTVYFCPNNLLVEQVCSQAKLYGIPVCTIEKQEGTRRDFPLDYSNMNSILVTTFEQLFNGQSIFGIKNNSRREIQKLGALVIDDAHECIAKARDKSTVEIFKNDNEEIYNDILYTFEEDLSEQGEGVLRSIKRGERTVIQQVPSWAWQNKLTIINNILEKRNNEDNPIIFFNLPLISENLNLCECYISGQKIEITPISVPVDNIPSYKNAKHRYVLSATLTNGYELVSDLDIENEAVKKPITVDNTQLGERLILAPKRINPNFTDENIRKQSMKWAEEFNINVAVIVPNKFLAQKWHDLGADLVDNDNIQEKLQQLKNTKGNIFVFINRYDGIDLIDDMCRILVLEGMPTKESLKDKIEMQYREDSIYLNLKRAQVIEQGMGRAVRSGTDYCSTILIGNDLLTFVGKKQNMKLFSPSVQAQIDFGTNIQPENKTNQNEVEKAMTSAIQECLSADEEWRKFHKKIINDAFNNNNVIELEVYINIASLLRSAEKYSLRKDEKNIDHCMSKIIEIVKRLPDEGWYYQPELFIVS